MIYPLPIAPVRPTKNVTDPRFEYTPSEKTDVTKTWRKFGWVPLTSKEGECNMHIEPSKK